MKKDDNLAEQLVVVEHEKPISNQEKIILLIKKCHTIRRLRSLQIQ